MLENFNHLLEDNFSPKSLKWRFDAWRNGTPCSKFIMLQTLDYQNDKQHIILAQRQRIRVLEEYLRLATLQPFSARSEKLAFQLDWFDAAETEVTLCELEAQLPEESRIRPQKKTRQRGFSDTLQRVQIHLSLADEEKAGAARSFIKEVRALRLAGRYFRHLRHRANAKQALNRRRTIAGILLRELQRKSLVPTLPRGNETKKGSVPLLHKNQSSLTPSIQEKDQSSLTPLIQPH